MFTRKFFFHVEYLTYVTLKKYIYVNKKNGNLNFIFQHFPFRVFSRTPDSGGPERVCRIYNTNWQLLASPEAVKFDACQLKNKKKKTMKNCLKCQCLKYFFYLFSVIFLVSFRLFSVRRDKTFIFVIVFFILNAKKKQATLNIKKVFLFLTRKNVRT